MEYSSDMDRVTEAIDRQIAEGDLETVTGDDGVTRYRSTELGRLRVQSIVAHAAVAQIRAMLEDIQVLLEASDRLLHLDPPELTMVELRTAIGKAIPEDETETPERARGYL